MEPITFSLGAATTFTMSTVGAASCASSGVTVITAAAATGSAVAAAPVWLPVAAGAAVGAIVGGVVVAAVSSVWRPDDTPPTKSEEGECVLGRGAFGLVALHTDTAGRRYAVKTVSHRVMQHCHQLHHLETERQTLELCQPCPFIVQYYFHVRTHEQTMFVMEALKDLTDTYQRENLYGWEGLVRLHGACVASALEFIHGKKLIYRDLKPKNLLLNNRGVCKLCDFGLCKDVAKDGRANSFVGTAEYMAPEMLVRKASYDAAIDLWAYGCLLFELLCGQRFFTGPRDQVFGEIASGAVAELVFPSERRSPAEDLIQALLQHDPSQRLSISGIKTHLFFDDFSWPDFEKHVSFSAIKDALPADGKQELEAKFAHKTATIAAGQCQNQPPQAEQVSPALDNSRAVSKFLQRQGLVKRNVWRTEDRNETIGAHVSKNAGTGGVQNRVVVGQSCFCWFHVTVVYDK